MNALEQIQNVEGWLMDEEANLLYLTAMYLTRPGCIVEVGSYRGRSTIMLALGARSQNRTVYAVDPHAQFDNGIDHYGPQDRVAFLDNLLKAGLAETVAPVGLPSIVAAAGWQEPIAMLWIDGAHEYDVVKADIRDWTPHLVDNAVIAFHDSMHDSVSRAINELLEDDRYKIEARANATTVIRFRDQRARKITHYDVSVLIPCYNGSATIERAIMSAVNQPGVSVEVVVCNDASTDDSAHKLEALSIQPGVTVVTHSENRGLAAALNTAAAVATGRYFIELDADDWLADDCLSVMVRTLDSVPETIGFVYGQTQYHGLSDYRFVPQSYRRGIFYQGFASLYAFLYRRAAWDAGCRYRQTCLIDGKRITIQDWDMALQLTEHMRYDALALDTLVLHYNHAPGSLTDFTNLHNAEVVAAFRKRWPRVVVEKI